MGILVVAVIVYVDMVVVRKILARSLHAIVESFALHIAKFLRWRIPVTVIEILSYSRGKGRSRNCVGSARIGQHH